MRAEGPSLGRAGAPVKAAWGRDAPALAQLTLQKPFRVAIHASTMLRAQEQS